jgi:hypothetical protein
MAHYSDPWTWFVFKKFKICKRGMKRTMLREKWTHVSDLLTAVIIRATISETWANIYETWPNIPEDSIFTDVPVYILVQCLLSVQSGKLQPCVYKNKERTLEWILKPEQINK